MPKSTPNSGYPSPLVIPPLRPPHKQTLIILHGRGSSGEKFGPALLDSEFTLSGSTCTPPPTLPSASASEINTDAGTTTLRQAFPHARFVFPTAARRRATLYGRSHTHQWFDNWELDPPATEREELQAPGLRETVGYLHGLLRWEIPDVPGGASSILLGGLSQGCAASLVSLLLLEAEEPLAGVFGMCGWLPYAVRIGEQLNPLEGDNGGGGDDDPFERGDEKEESDPPTRAISWLREEIEVAQTCALSTELLCRKIPVFLGHGVEDDRVGVVLGRSALSVLRDMGVDAEWKEYEGLGHWYSPDMLRDLVFWVREKTGWVPEGRFLHAKTGDCFILG